MHMMELSWGSGPVLCDTITWRPFFSDRLPNYWTKVRATPLHKLWAETNFTLYCTYWFLAPSPLQENNALICSMHDTVHGFDLDFIQQNISMHLFWCQVVSVIWFVARLCHKFQIRALLPCSYPEMKSAFNLCKKTVQSQTHILRKLKAAIYTL